MPSNVNFSADAASDEASKGMREMCMNILMEAEEKCEEIDVKCEEEHRYLKFKEIIEQRAKVKKILEKKRADVDREFRVFMTKLSNQSRLAQLKAKNDIVKQIMDEVKVKLSQEKGSNYTKLLKHSIVQALYMMMEPEVKVVCKRDEGDLVLTCLRDVVVEYEATTLLHVKVCIAKETLPDKSVGGVVVSNMTDDISVDCRLDSRAEQVCRLAMPLIVEMLFADVKLTGVVRDSPTGAVSRVQGSLIASTSKSVFIKDDDEMRARGPVPLREQGVHSSTIALPVRSPSTSSRSPESGYAREPAVHQMGPVERRRMESSASMETATPSPQRTLKSASDTPSMSPPQPLLKDDKNNPKPRK